MIIKIKEINVNNLLIKIQKYSSKTRIILILFSFIKVTVYNIVPVWKVCIAQPRYWARNFDALYIFTSKLLNLRCAVFKLSSQDIVYSFSEGYMCLRTSGNYTQVKILTGNS